MFHLLWRTVRRFLKILKTELPCDPETPLLGIHLEKAVLWKDTRAPAFTAALFTTAKMRKQRKRPSGAADNEDMVRALLLSPERDKLTTLQ